MNTCLNCGGRGMKRLDGVRNGTTSTRIYACRDCEAVYEVEVTETRTVRRAAKRYLRGNSVYRETATA